MKASSRSGWISSSPSFENLAGGTKADVFFMEEGGFITGSITGKGGVDRLDYSHRQNDVQVNLAAGVTTDIEGMVAEVENATGGDGDDTLIGDNGKNLLDGGHGNDLLVGLGGKDTMYGDGLVPQNGVAGNDVLIGGAAADKLFGGHLDDLVIAGGTAFDGDADALTQILEEWANLDETYDRRVNTLRIGLPLDAATVMDDAAVDLLTGGKGLDWFLARQTQDTISDLEGGEVVN